MKKRRSGCVSQLAVHGCVTTVVAGLAAGIGVAGVAAVRSCFGLATPIRVPGGTRDLGDLRADDEVIALGRDGPVVRRVLAVHDGRAPATLRIRAPGVRIAGVTALHPLFDARTRRYVPAGGMGPRTRLVAWSGTSTAPERPRLVPGDVAVRTLTVAGPERNFFADDVLVHNKTPDLPLIGAYLDDYLDPYLEPTEPEAPPPPEEDCDAEGDEDANGCADADDVACGGPCVLFAPGDSYLPRRLVRLELPEGASAVVGGEGELSLQLVGSHEVELPAGRLTSVVRLEDGTAVRWQAFVVNPEHEDCTATWNVDRQRWDQPCEEPEKKKRKKRR